LRTSFASRGLTLAALALRAEAAHAGYPEQKEKTTPVPTAAAPRTGEPAGRAKIDYFALGDSVASGHGLRDDEAPCRRSLQRAYPAKVAKRLARTYDVDSSGSS